MRELAAKGENAMKCIACGREMLDRGTHFECSNMLCDYEEANDAQEVLVKSYRVTNDRLSEVRGQAMEARLFLCI